LKKSLAILKDFENRERSFMSPFGCLSAESRGRMKAEVPCPVRAAFQLDRDRIVYSKAFRRFISSGRPLSNPIDPHYRSRSDWKNHRPGNVPQ